jgi:hypothetical protein
MAALFSLCVFVVMLLVLLMLPVLLMLGWPRRLRM